MKLVQFGAGKIGRSFLGQLFARGGYEVVFIDVDENLVDAVNRAGRYRVIVKRTEAPDETLWVENVRAVAASATASVTREIVSCDIIATSVGKSALPRLFPPIAEGLLERRKRSGRPAVDLIIAENLRRGAELLRDGLRAELPSNFPLDEAVGLVETSIGKMVPIMTEEDIRADPLWIFAEAYNTLIVDRRGFRGEVPTIPGLEAVENIRAYIDRKLFIHNLGHAAIAYLGYARNPAYTYVWEPLRDPSVAATATAAMREAAVALHCEYPSDFTPEALEGHVQDLLRRFANRSLGDTLYRVGRDLYRKLHRDDRLIGACLLAARHGVSFPSIAKAVRAAIGFGAWDEHGAIFADDERFAAAEVPKGLNHVLTSVCGLDPGGDLDRVVIAGILGERG